MDARGHRPLDRARESYTSRYAPPPISGGSRWVELNSRAQRKLYKKGFTYIQGAALNSLRRDLRNASKDLQYRSMVCGGSVLC